MCGGGSRAGADMSVRRVALEALLDITDRGAYANLRLKKRKAGYPNRDARWVAARRI
jgi:hypothetical protein